MPSQVCPIGLFSAIELALQWLLRIGVGKELPCYSSSGLVVKVRGVIRHGSGHYYGVQFVAANGDEQRELTLVHDFLRHAAGHLGQPSY